MQNFSTKEIRHDFTVDGVPYFMPGVNVGDLEQVARLSELEGEAQIAEFRDFLAGRAKTPSPWAFWRRHPRRAVAALTPQQLSDLFKEWTGMGRSVGESSSSPASV